MTFAALGLGPTGQQAAAARGYSAPTPVQAAAIPAILAGRDLCARAQTGSGKTAAFALPLIERCLRRPAGAPLQGLILAPTRELAAQLAHVIEIHAQPAPRRVKIVLAHGGVSINPQMMAMRGGADLLIATPGRLLDLIDHHAVQLHGLATLVLDEADRLFSLGFADELARVLAELPPRRQNLLFSATFPPAVESLVTQLLHDPLRIEVPDTPITLPQIAQRAVRVDRARRTQLLRRLLDTHAWAQVLVFTATRYTADHVAEKLRRLGVTTAALHGDLSQAVRTQSLADFSMGRVRVLLATDLAARGLDIVGLPAVVNFDLPRSTDDYVHRIGRTGRAGSAGVAISFVTVDDEAHFALIEKRQRFTVPRETVPGFEPTDIATPAVPGGGVKGRRKSKKDRLREAAAAQSASGATIPRGTG